MRNLLVWPGGDGAMIAVIRARNTWGQLWPQFPQTELYGRQWLLRLPPFPLPEERAVPVLVDLLFVGRPFWSLTEFLWADPETLYRRGEQARKAEFQHLIGEATHRFNMTLSGYDHDEADGSRAQLAVLFSRHASDQ